MAYKKRNFKKWQRIEIYWIDSAGEDGWKNEKHTPVDDDALIIRSVGYFRGYSKECIHIVQSYHGPFDDGTHNTDSRLQVPVVAIKKIVTI